MMMGLMVYAFYVTCLSNGAHQGGPGRGGAGGGGGGSGGGGGGGGTGTNRPPPYGFRHQPNNGSESLIHKYLIFIVIDYKFLISSISFI